VDHSLQRKLGAAEIAAQLRREISSGHLKMHDRLPPERRLAETFGVARGTVREALARLEEEGFVETQASSGTYVTFDPMTPAGPIANANPLELIDARFALEPHVCRLAVLNGRRSDFEQLTELCRTMEANARDPHAFAEADTQFHKVLAQCTGNGLLIWIMGQISSVRNQDEWTRMRQLTLDDAIIDTYNAQHRAIVDAIRTREPELAAGKMKDHLETARLSLTRAAAT